jgi:FtsP/CotA-like multicopper oxidase with cupredoxin domain
MHIHGQFFKVLARDGRPVEERHWRDTVLVRPRETVDVGLVPLDLGLWMLHCHILEHAESGMMTLVEVVR